MQQALEWIGKNWFQCITAAVALYGAIVSTVNLISRRKEKIRKLKVEITSGWMFYDNKIPGLLIKIINLGFRSVTVEHPYIQILDTKKYLICPIPIANVNFPYELREGKSCVECVSENEIRSELKKIGLTGKVKLLAIVADQTGKKFKASKPIEFDIDKQSTPIP